MEVEKEKKVEKPPSRRDFLKIAGLVVGTGIALPAIIHKRSTAAEWEQEEVDERQKQWDMWALAQMQQQKVGEEITEVEVDQWMAAYEEMVRVGMVDCTSVDYVSGCGVPPTPKPTPRPWYPTAVPTQPTEPTTTPTTGPTPIPTPVGPLPTGQFNQGLNPGWPMGDGGENLIGDWVAAGMAEAGAGRARIEFKLHPFTEWNSQVLGVYDQVFNTLAARNVKVLGLIDYASWVGGQTEWNKNNAEWGGGDGMNEYIQAMVDRALVPILERFGDRMEVLQVWNEPNAWNYKDANGRRTGGSFLEESVYAMMLKKIYDKTNELKPNLPIVSAGIFTWDGDRGTSYSYQTHNQGRKYAGWSQGYPYDGWGQHVYIDQSKLTIPWRVELYLSGMRYMMNTYSGGYNKGLWLTEIGWQSDALGSGEVGLKNQATNLETAYNYFKAKKATWNLGPAFWYRFTDYPGISWGLVNSQGKKPAWEAFRRAASF